MNEIKLFHRIIICVLLLLASAAAQAQDTSRVKTLQSVSVGASRPVEATAQAPVQVLGIEKLEQTGVTTLSDAAKQLSGVVLRDYGGVGGVKTVSARGLGSQFSTLTIDGVAVNDCQNGQVDLGRYQLGNTEYVSFANGQHNASLQTARGYAAGNVLNMESRTPRFGKENHHGKVGVEGGSFGFLSPSLLWEQRLGQRLSLSLWANGLKSDGDYPFTLYYGNNAGDSSSREIRNHSRVESGTIDGNLFWNISGSQSLVAKVHYAQSSHQLPGPVIFYTQKGSEQTASQLFFAQGRYKNKLSEKFRLQVVGKYSRMSDTYEDSAANNTLHYTRSEYLQNEGYLSLAGLYEPVEHLHVSLATDASASTLESNLAKNNEVQRLTSLNVLALGYRCSRFDVDANAVATIADEHTNSGLEHSYRKLSPYAGATLLLWPLDLNDAGETACFVRLRYFFKENYRLPNFSEMYFFSITRDLNPEKAQQHNVGLTFSKGGVQATVDGYFNRVTDKIVAIPMQSLFLWSMRNLGKVEILGLDANLDVDLHPKALSWCDIALHTNYSFQRALDVTDPGKKNYQHQIPYTPRHSGGATLTMLTPWVDLGYSLVAVGDRYRLGQNTESNLVKGYVDQGVTLSRSFSLRPRKENGLASMVRVKAQVLNLFDVQYEVIKSYPMMGRNYRLGVSWEF
ncbi:MAG: TonB-dependent receptor [Bacteroidales bacterium]|nr:TonB-dependent receptor [Bacteroidales bacterium]